MNTNIHLTNDQINSIDFNTHKFKEDHIHHLKENYDNQNNNTSPEIEQNELTKFPKSQSLPSIKSRNTLTNKNIKISTKIQEKINQEKDIKKKRKILKQFVP